MPSEEAPTEGASQGQGTALARPSAASGPVASELVVERPPPGLLRGKIGAPAGLIAALGALALGVSIVFYLRKSTFGRAARAR